MKNFRPFFKFKSLESPSASRTSRGVKLTQEMAPSARHTAIELHSAITPTRPPIPNSDPQPPPHFHLQQRHPLRLIRAARNALTTGQSHSTTKLKRSLMWGSCMYCTIGSRYFACVLAKTGDTSPLGVRTGRHTFIMWRQGL